MEKNCNHSYGVTVKIRGFPSPTSGAYESDVWIIGYTYHRTL